MKPWLKFSLVGVANVLISASVLLLFVFGGEALQYALIPIFVAEGFLLYRLTSKSGRKCKYLWTTILTYVLLVATALTYLWFALNAPRTYGGLIWAVIAMVAFGILILTAITCLIVWIIQVIKRKNLRRNDYEN